MRRSVAAGVLVAIASIVPLTVPAYAQDLDCRHFAYQEEAQAVFDSDPTDPHRLDEDQGPDDGVACEALPRRSTTVPAPTTPPTTPSAVAPRPPQPSYSTPGSVTATPDRGVRGGLGGSATSGSGGWYFGLGLVAVAGAFGGYVYRRRRNTQG
ncbi:excalibur calcium-binding protein [Streptomyces sp. enrichment culture]|uniref:excalibur calcium-binding protein n=1 Tax=Streptomyces sp. enrichment culture TaxID=1795815 RepID=UPI003F55D395